MNLVFWIIAAVMTVAALAFVVPVLLRPPRSTVSDDVGIDAAVVDSDTARKREALAAAHAAGVLSDAELETKLAALPGVAAAARANPDTVAGAVPGSEPVRVHGPARRSAVLVALAVPVAAAGLYWYVGEPTGIGIERPAPSGLTVDGGPAADGQAPSLEQATAGLAERMRESPDDLGGWMLLGRAYKSMQRFDASREALANAYRLAPEDPDVMTEYAEALTLAGEDRRIAGEAARLLDAALERNPAHERALWLKGIQAYQAGDYAGAAGTWERLRAALPPGADVAATLDERIADARSRSGLAPVVPPADAAAATGTTAAGNVAAPATPAPTPPAPAAGNRTAAAQLTVQVDVTPELRARIGASDVLFVFARAPQGSRMPVAIQRLSAASLPVTVTLDDSTSMMPQLKLSSLPEVVVGARISRSGEAIPQAGDLEALSDPVPNNRAAPVSLTIDRVVQ